MNISWVLSDLVLLDPTQDVADLKRIGTFWGSWRTWRACQTDNVLCHDLAKAAELLKRNFQTTCNFYIPNSIYTSLDRPAGVKLYEGAFVHDVDRQEEIVCMHLAASVSDIVLLYGFDFSEVAKLPDKLDEHRAYNYRNLTQQVVISNPQVQWVVIDHDLEFRSKFQSLTNVTRDSLSNVLQMTI
jgi:hypothetical protein